MGKNKPETPKAVISNYNDGFGGSSTTTMNGNNQSTTYNPSSFEKSQYDYYKGVAPQLQNSLFDQKTADLQATSYADNIKSQGLKRFSIDQADALGGAQANNARRFGSLSNSDYDSQMKTFAREANSGLADINNQYDINKNNYINDYNNRYTNLLGTANGVYNNTQGLGSTLNSGSMAGYSAGNAFNQTNFQNQASMYNADQAKQAAMYQAIGSAASGIGTGVGGYLSGKNVPKKA